MIYGIYYHYPSILVYQVNYHTKMDCRTYVCVNKARLPKVTCKFFISCFISGLSALRAYVLILFSTCCTHHTKMRFSRLITLLKGSIHRELRGVEALVMNNVKSVTFSFFAWDALVKYKWWGYFWRLCLGGNPLPNKLDARRQGWFFSYLHIKCMTKVSHV